MRLRTGSVNKATDWRPAFDVRQFRTMALIFS
jgi:hypothetical protein